MGGSQGSPPPLPEALQRRVTGRHVMPREVVDGGDDFHAAREGESGDWGIEKIQSLARELPRQPPCPSAPIGLHAAPPPLRQAGQKPTAPEQQILLGSSQTDEPDKQFVEVGLHAGPLLHQKTGVHADPHGACILAIGGDSLSAHPRNAIKSARRTDQSCCTANATCSSRRPPVRARRSASIHSDSVLARSAGEPIRRISSRSEATTGRPAAKYSYSFTG